MLAISRDRTDRALAMIDRQGPFTRITSWLSIEPS
jgi:hypothetical protein